MATLLFACAKCNSRHPFEELSSGQQLCKDCRGACPVVKCTYCRTESQKCFKGSIFVCKKCDAKVKQYGEPSACEYCNITAAFIGSKCQHCTNSEKKYGPPVTCEQCKQSCAFERNDDGRKKCDGKLLCWLCTLSYKRVLAKVKRCSSVPQSSSMSLNKSSHHHSQNPKRPHSSASESKKTEQHNSSKKSREEITKSTDGSLPASDNTPPLVDPNMSDHVMALTQLKEQIAELQRQLLLKDQQILAKDKQRLELKAQYGVLERELRLKIQAMNKSHMDTLDDLQSKNRVLQKQVASLTKLTKKNATKSPQ